MVLFRKLMAWQKYLGTQLALAEVDEKLADRKVKQAESRSMIMAEGRTVTEKRASAKGDPHLEETADALQEIYGYRKLVESLHEGVETDTFLCSRELTRRMGTADRVRRDSRYGT